MADAPATTPSAGGTPGAGAAAPAAPGNLLADAGKQTAAAAVSAATSGQPAPAAPENWRAALGDEYKDNATLATIPTVSALAKAYLDTKQMVGKKLSPPGDGSTPEQVAEWRRLVGAPEKPEDYGSLMPEKFPKEMWNAEIEKEAIELANKHHLPVAVLKEFAALQAKGTQSIYENEVAAAKAALEKGRAELKTAWGADFDRRAAEATALATALGIDPTDDIFTSRPDILMKLAKAAPSMLGGDRVVNGVPVSVSGGLQERINSIRDGADYQGKNGSARQQAAAEQMRQLIAAQSKVAA